MNKKCKDCKGYVNESCCCALANSIKSSLVRLGIDPNECWLSGLKINYSENVIKSEDVQVDFIKVEDVITYTSPYNSEEEI